MTRSRTAFAVVVLVLLLTGYCAALLVTSAMRRRAESVTCGNTMVSIGCAARLYADEHGDRFPARLALISNELVIPKVLVCPSDHSRTPASSWAEFTDADSSYEIVTPGLRRDQTNAVFLRCRIHGYQGYGDGTVFDGLRRRLKTP